MLLDAMANNTCYAMTMKNGNKAMNDMANSNKAQQFGSLQEVTIRNFCS